MGLKDDIVAASTGRTAHKCIVGTALEKLPPKDAAELQEALDADREDIPHVVIAEVLAKRGFGTGDSQPVSRHRRGICCRGDR